MNPQRDRIKQGVTGEGQVVVGLKGGRNSRNTYLPERDFVRMEKTERIMAHIGVQNFEPTT